MHLRTWTRPLLAASWLIWLAAPVCPESRAQDALDAATPEAPVPAPPPGRTAITTLRSVLDSLDLIKDEIAAKQEQIAAATEADKPARLAELTELNQRRAQLQTDFAEIATGIDSIETPAAEPPAFDWKSELDELLTPLLGQLKDATKLPREIEKLRTELEFNRERLATAGRALERIRELKSSAEDSELVQALSDEELAWERHVADAENRVDILSYQLDGSLAARKPFLEMARDALTTFFGTRGWNLLLAISAFFGVFFLLRLLPRWLTKLRPKTSLRGRSFSSRLLEVLYAAFTVVGAISATLFVLYATGDWVLMGLAMIVLVGVALAAKTGVARFYGQARLLLNLGDVREGERVIYRGVPWRVDVLGFYTELVNPELTGGKIRLPLAQLPGMNSRPFEKGELWFPCHEGDWVVLADATFGKIVLQTPETVQLVQLGGSRKTYPTDAFLDEAAENLSHGFRVAALFGIDYGHQAIATSEIPAILTDRIASGLREIVAAEAVVNVRAELAGAGASSLDYEVMADFSGDVASKYNVLRRAISKIAVDVCNERGWVIPFTQVTVHQA